MSFKRPVSFSQIPYSLETKTELRLEIRECPSSSVAYEALVICYCW